MSKSFPVGEDQLREKLGLIGHFTGVLKYPHNNSFEAARDARLCLLGVLGSLGACYYDLSISYPAFFPYYPLSWFLSFLRSSLRPTPMTY